MARVQKTWYGGEIAARANRAAGRAIVAIGENVAAETKAVTHVESGTLRRSVHAAPVGYDGSRDEEFAETTDLSGRSFMPTQTAAGPAIEVGSWLRYACAEWVGRGHPGVTQGLELTRTSADATVQTAFKQEGL